MDHVVALTIAVFLIIGGYQVYFLPQRRPLRAPRQILLELDKRIPFRPGWVWLYSGLYYPFILALCLTTASLRQFAYMAFSFLLLLLVHVTVFFVFPVSSPASWRDYDHSASLSHRMLGFVHRFDARTNCFPSTHVSVAVLSALHMQAHLHPRWPTIASLTLLFPVLISASTLFTKQHRVVDIPPGVALGYLFYFLYGSWMQ